MSKEIHPFKRVKGDAGKVRWTILPDNLPFDPRDCIKRSIELEKAGFNGIQEGDHILPVHHTGGHCSGAFSHLIELLHATKNVCCGMTVWAITGIRYSPIQFALEMATAALFHGSQRIFIGVGTGEAMNDLSATGCWPSATERRERLEEAIQLVKRAWETAITKKPIEKYKGKYFNVPFFYLYDKPEGPWPPPIIVAASGPKSAYSAGKLGDGMCCIASPDLLKDSLIPAFKKGAKEAGRDPDLMEIWSFVSTAYHPEDPFTIARKYAGFLVPELYDVPDPRIIEARALMIRDDVIKAVYNVSSKIDGVIDGFDRYIKAGANGIIWDEISPDPWMTPKIFKEKIKPYFTEQYGAF